jgi:hypothetical protein
MIGGHEALARVYRLSQAADLASDACFSLCSRFEPSIRGCHPETSEIIVVHTA